MAPTTIRAAHTHDAVPHRGIITVCAMVATLMQALDSTIANVALPNMQGPLDASPDQITWVLTSYIVAAAIMTAPVGWMAQRFGRRRLFLICIVGFTAASMLCGIAQSLEQMVIYRLLQGVFGAALVPLSQATMLDIYPLEKRGSAMAMWGMGVMVGPILGPTLGGYLTEYLSWRWVFYVNLPFGLAATLGILLYMREGERNDGLAFDWTGFALLSLGVGALQLMLDRGENLAWFDSREIIVETVLAVLGFYLFIVHMFTAKKPFIPPHIFRDLNFVSGLILMFLVGMILLASSALLAPYLQTLGGYPVIATGLLMAPRGIGTMASMMVAGRLAARYDPRLLMAFGIILLAGTLGRMSGWTPDVAEHELIVTTIVQGFGLGFVFIPLQVLAFATLAPADRTDGAAMFSLGRNMGSAIGISVMQFLLIQNSQIMHAEIGQFVTPFNRLLQTGASKFYWDATTAKGAALLDLVIGRQAIIIAYANDFKLMMIVGASTLLLLPLMRRPKTDKRREVDTSHAVLD